MEQGFLPTDALPIARVKLEPGIKLERKRPRDAYADALHGRVKRLKCQCHWDEGRARFEQMLDNCQALVTELGIVPAHSKLQRTLRSLNELAKELRQRRLAHDEREHLRARLYLVQARKLHAINPLPEEGPPTPISNSKVTHPLKWKAPSKGK